MHVIIFAVAYKFLKSKAIATPQTRPPPPHPRGGKACMYKHGLVGQLDLDLTGIICLIRVRGNELTACMVSSQPF